MGRELKHGFVFSLDAFVAFSLILVSIQSLLVISAIPKAYYPGLLQADNLATDTLQALSLADCHNLGGCSGADSGKSILAVASHNVVNNITFTPTDPIVTATDSLIPSPYSYAYYFFNFSGQSWDLLYNASSQPADPHFGIPFHRVQASAQTMVMSYDLSPIVPSSPYCNVVCKGWQRTLGTGGANASASDCVTLPCNTSITNFYEPGDFNVGLLRLVVWG